MQLDREQAREADEVRVGREDREAAALGRRADEEVGVRSLDAPRAAYVEMLRRTFEVLPRQRLILERPQMIAEAVERGRVADAAEQFLPDRPNDGDTPLVDQRPQLGDDGCRLRVASERLQIGRASCRERV